MFTPDPQTLQFPPFGPIGLACYVNIYLEVAIRHTPTFTCQHPPPLHLCDRGAALLSCFEDKRPNGFGLRAIPLTQFYKRVASAVDPLMSCDT